jgi:hypothetical protein
MLRHVALVRTEVSEERSATIIRLIIISELGTTIAVTSNRRTLWRNNMSPWWRRRYVPPKRLFLQKPHSVTFEKTAFFCWMVSIFTNGLSFLPSWFSFRLPSVPGQLSSWPQYLVNRFLFYPVHFSSSVEFLKCGDINILYIFDLNQLNQSYQSIPLLTPNARINLVIRYSYILFI